MASSGLSCGSWVLQGSQRVSSGLASASVLRPSRPRLLTRLRCRSTYLRVAWPFPLSSMALPAIPFSKNRGSDGTSRSLVHLPRLLLCRLRPLRLHSTSESRGIRAGFVLPPVCRPTRLPRLFSGLSTVASALGFRLLSWLGPGCLLSTDVPRAALRPLDSSFRFHRREIDFRFQFSGVSSPDGVPLSEL